MEVLNELSVLKKWLLVTIALIAFAGNSVLCRLALGEGEIDASSFTAIRLISGVVMLWLLIALRSRSRATDVAVNWWPALMLFLYALTFSFAYLLLDTGVGALILFGVVQLTMVSVNAARGHVLRWSEWLGLLIALGGFVYLMLPSVLASAGDISLLGFGLMSISGVAWGVYTLLGKGSADPLRDTGVNFLKTMPLVMLSVVAYWIWAPVLSLDGVVLAVVSGAVTSGLGYAIWYAALKHLEGIQAAVVQLLVPVLAAAGGVMFAGEDLSLRLLIASVAILGGILLIVAVPRRI